MAKFFLMQILWLVILLTEYPHVSYGQGIDPHVPEKFIQKVTEGENFVIPCLFSLVDYKGNDNPNKNELIDTNIYWIYPNYNFTKINESRVTEEKLWHHDSIASFLTVTSGNSQTDEGYYMCFLYIDGVFLSQKQIYINFTKNADDGVRKENFAPSNINSNSNEGISPLSNSTSKVDVKNTPPNTVMHNAETKSNTTIIALLVSGIIILLIILAITILLFYKRKRERCGRTTSFSSPFVRYDRNNSVNSTVELTPYNPTPIS